MKCYGDITKLKGFELPVVDIVTGGSPCQDLSIAGKREGLGGERSGLFIEQIRVIKEMREHDRTVRGTDEHIRPRYMVWENVAGAFTSNKGEDFRTVLEETAKIADENAVIPGLEGGRWPDAGCIMGDGYSIAWRVHDAQFWGVPQRRKRICLLADFNGDTAPKILFELQPEAVDGDTEQAFGYSGNVARPEIQSVTEGVSGDIESGEEAREEIAGIIREDSDTAIYDVRISSDGTKNWRAHAYETDISRNLDTGGATQTVTTEDSQSSRTLCLNDQGGSQMEVTENITGTLRAQEHGHQPIVYGIGSYDSNAMKSSNPYSGICEAQTTRTLDNNGGNSACNQGGMVVVEPIPINTMVATRETDEKRTTFGIGNEGDPQFTIGANHEHAVFCIEGNGSRESHKGDGYKESETMYTLNTVEQHAVCVGNGQTNNISMEPVANALDTMHDQQAVMVYGIDRASFNQGQNAQFDFSVEEEKAQTIVSRGPGGVLTKR